MRLPRDLSGERLVSHLCSRWSYRRAGQAGSHVALETNEPSRQRLVVPAHKHLRVGTLNAILRRVATHKDVSRSDVLRDL